MRPLDRYSLPQRQQGVALLIALVILLVLTVAGITSMRSSVLQERMAGNTRDREVAFQNAEGALRRGERFLSSSGSTPSPSSGTFFFSAASTNAPDPYNFSCTGSKIKSVDVNKDGAMDGCYFIQETELLGGGGITKPGSPAKTSKFYTVVAQGSGNTDRTQVILRSSYNE